MDWGIPGKILQIQHDAFGVPIGTVDFGGFLRHVCLSDVPGLRVGDWVMVHLGHAIARIGPDASAGGGGPVSARARTDGVL